MSIDKVRIDLFENELCICTKIFNHRDTSTSIESRVVHMLQHEIQWFFPHVKLGEIKNKFYWGANYDPVESNKVDMRISIRDTVKAINAVSSALGLGVKYMVAISRNNIQGEFIE